MLEPEDVLLDGKWNLSCQFLWFSVTFSNKCLELDLERIPKAEGTEVFCIGKWPKQVHTSSQGHH